jgi:uncharacterized protein YlxW (UPF0749 family)
MRRNVRRINKEVGKSVDGPIYLKDGLEAAVMGLVPIEGPILRLAPNHVRRDESLSPSAVASSLSIPVNAMSRQKFTEEEIQQRKEDTKEFRKKQKLESKERQRQDARTARVRQKEAEDRNRRDKEWEKKTKKTKRQQQNEKNEKKKLAGTSL